MNSTLQCLAHTSPLRSYFLSGEFANDLNKDNPLGTGGELAVEFAKLLAEMWGTKQDDDDSKGNRKYGRTWSTFSGSSNVVYPRDFKYILGKHAEQFMGYNQHDSQELATYLLDALHEDTNRVSKKPYIEKPEQGENETDDDAAKRAWDLHLKREDSKVMENFMGQVKSRVECPIEGCGRVSTTFDPFMYLSVPLPGATERTIELEYYSINPDERFKRFKITLPKNSNCLTLRDKLAEKINDLKSSSPHRTVDPENIILAEKFQHEIYKVFSVDDDIEKIRDSDHIMAYEVASTDSIHEEIEMNKSNTSTHDKDEVNNEKQKDDRPNGRLQLGITTLTKLNKDQQWETSLEKYIRQTTLLPSLLNPNRSNTEKREAFYTKLSTFINKCYASMECTEALRGRATPTSDLELESCDGDDSEDGKMSPTTTVTSRLGATVVDDESLMSLEELSTMSPTFHNVSTVEDVAIIEFCSNKFRQYLQNLKESKKLEFVDGTEVQIVFQRPSRIGHQFQSFSNPFVVRLSPTMTVFGLRELLAKSLSRVLSTIKIHVPIKSELSKDENMDCSSDHKHSDISDSDDIMNIIRQIPFTYDRCGTTYSPYRYSQPKSNSYRKLGSIATPDDKTNTSSKDRGMFAMCNDEEERELVLDHVGKHGRVNICFPTSAIEELFNDKEWSKVEVIDDPNNENDGPKLTTVNDCIAKYCQIEQLEESEMWYCNKCKEHVRAWKQFHLYRTPPILIVHLKRFHYSATTHRRDKIDTFIDFPLKGLDLTKEVTFWENEHEPIYDCYAVSNHFGGLGGGHYTAYALNDDGEWCNFDDSRVTTNVDEKDILSSAAYVLYYKRRDVKVDDECWINRTLPLSASSSRESLPIDSDMDNELFSMEENNNDDNEYGTKGLFDSHPQ